MAARTDTTPPGDRSAIKKAPRTAGLIDSRLAHKCPLLAQPDISVAPLTPVPLNSLCARIRVLVFDQHVLAPEVGGFEIAACEL